MTDWLLIIALVDLCLGFLIARSLSETFSTLDELDRLLGIVTKDDER